MTGIDAVLERFSQEVLELLPAAIFIASVPSGRLVRWNRCAAALLPRRDLSACPLWELFHSRGADESAVSVRKDPIAIALKNGHRLRDVEAGIDGLPHFPVSISIEPIQGERGEPVASLTLCRRIEHREGVAAALRHSEQRLTQALSAGRLGAWEFNPITHVLTASAQCKANHGFSATEDIGFDTHVVPAIDPEYREAFRNEIRRAVGSAGSFEIEIPHLWPDGSHHWLFVAGRLVDSTSMVGVTRDVTDQKQTEQSLRDSEERFRALADNIAQLAWMADETGSIFWYNRRWFEYTGRRLEEMRGWGWEAVHHPDYVQNVTSKIRRCFQTGDIWEDTFPLRGADGNYRWFLSRAVPIRAADGRIVRWFGTNTDITEQRRAQESLLVADRSKDEFLATVAHELRNPLAAILASARLLQRMGLADELLLKQCEAIQRQTSLLARLVEDLLDVGRITAGKLALDRGVADLNKIATDAIETCSSLIERRRHTLNTVLAKSPVYVDVDATRIVQVVSNLLTNAAKYMHEGGRLELAVRQRNDTAIVSVRDEGEGIEPEMLGRIFHRFIQVSSSAHRAQGGLGIGLAVVKALVDLHGGTVEARSDGVGRGSEFTVCLPLAADQHPSP